jgi:N utilization substance protein B
VNAGAERRVVPRARESRHAAREAAVQMLYQWEVGGTPIEDVARTFWTQTPRSEGSWDTQQDAGAGEAVQRFAGELARGVVSAVPTLDPMIAEAAQHWRLERMAIIDRLILRLAVYEFLHQPETPARVIINEALELTRTFSTGDAIRFINGMLDGLRRSLQRE